MATAIDALAESLASRNLDLISERQKAVFEQWRKYSTEHALTSIAQAAAPFCMSIRKDIFVTLEIAKENLRTLGDHPQQGNWENRLEALRMQAAATPDAAERLGADSLPKLVDLSKAVFGLSNEVLSARWDRVALSPTTRRWLATDLGTTLSQKTVQNFLSDVRVLQIALATPTTEQYEGREIHFRITNLDPAWKHGVELAVEFGDGTRQTMTAEEAGRGKLFVHTYARATQYPLRAYATPLLTLPPGETKLPELGTSPVRLLTIGTSPVSYAARWADGVFNIRYGLALLIAAVLYFWRLHVRSTAFGASSFDYARAFSLGFLASAGVNKLPDIIKDLFS